MYNKKLKKILDANIETLKYANNYKDIVSSDIKKIESNLQDLNLDLSFEYKFENDFSLFWKKPLKSKVYRICYLDDNYIEPVPLIETKFSLREKGYKMLDKFLESYIERLKINNEVKK